MASAAKNAHTPGYLDEVRGNRPRPNLTQCMAANREDEEMGTSIQSRIQQQSESIGKQANNKNDSCKFQTL